jgi:hypothetical protein
VTEPGLPGIAINRKDGSGTVVATTQTAAPGSYRFTDQTDLAATEKFTVRRHLRAATARQYLLYSRQFVAKLLRSVDSEGASHPRSAPQRRGHVPVVPPRGSGAL